MKYCEFCDYEKGLLETHCPTCGAKDQKSFSAKNFILIVGSLYLIGFFVTNIEPSQSDENYTSKVEKEEKSLAVDDLESEESGNESKVGSGQTSVYIPELNPADVYLSLEEIGFTTEKDLGSIFGNFWTSTLNKGGIEYKVDVSSDEVLKVQSIRGTVTNSNRNPDEVKQFFKYLVSSLFLYNNKNDSQINNWIENNFNNDNSTTSVGTVKVKISAPSTIMRGIRLDANLEDGM